MLSLIFIIVFSYLLGSLPFGIIITKLWKGIDIREHGSKNPGATNVYRVVGLIPALMVLILDVGKGLVATLLFSRISIDQPFLNAISLMILAGIAVILGHVFPIFVGFKGGKGVATGLGVLISLAPLETALALLLFLIIVAITRYVSLGSLSSASFILLALIFKKYYFHKPVSLELLVSVLVLTIFIFYTHRSNIKRLLNGTENKFGKKIT
ncbi:MAG: acyl-phosphate glycerol 3-phosphate acyltransferase [candidate division Zixibacteria bacterium RBG_16_43_9]|nr:MAG: acyl-phosphate glycerol 3-phosphate acyltransferase [candidate division Zixibacteria bacterium RBG_16_43_9]